jgi:hypothetical protein
MTWEQAGVWLVGIGSAVVVTATISGAPRPGKPQLWLPLRTRRERMAFAGESSGLLLVGAGGVILAVVRFPPWWFVASTAAAAVGAFYLLVAWKQHQHRVVARDGPPPELANDLEWKYACRRYCATWRWCLLHPLDDTEFPSACRNLPGAPDPG